MSQQRSSEPANHTMANTSAYDNLGQFRLGMMGVNAMG